MSIQLQERRGLKADLPSSAPAGQLLFCTDTNELFIGTGSGIVICETDARSLQGTKVNTQAPTDGQVYIYDQATQTLIPGDPIVSGPDAPGVAPTRNPVQIGGFDGTFVRRIKTNAAGEVSVNVTSGGGGAATIADGADTAQGTTTDPAWASGAGTVIGLLKKIASAGGSAVSVADGSDVAEGLTTDALLLGDAAGTISAKLRGINYSLDQIRQQNTSRLLYSLLAQEAAFQPQGAGFIITPEVPAFLGGF